MSKVEPIPPLRQIDVNGKTITVDRDGCCFNEAGEHVILFTKPSAADWNDWSARLPTPVGRP